MAISTRGSGEALVTVQILLMLNCLLQGKVIHARWHLDLTSCEPVKYLLHCLPHIGT